MLASVRSIAQQWLNILKVERKVGMMDVPSVGDRTALASAAQADDLGGSAHARLGDKARPTRVRIIHHFTFFNDLFQTSTRMKECSVGAVQVWDGVNMGNVPNEVGAREKEIRTL